MKYNNFTDLFKQYIQDAQLNISTLAKNSGVDRTLIQKYISGNRLPSNYNIVEKIIQFLALTETQKRELKCLYKIEKMGYEKFSTLLLLKNMILELDDNQVISSSVHSTYTLIKEFTFAKNIDELKLLTQYILNKIQPSNDILQISLNTDNQLFTIIFQFCKKFSNMKIDIFLHLETEKIKVSNYNLFQLKQLISFFKISKNINIHYAYIDNPSDYSLYPFLICTNNLSLLINGTITSGILLKDYNSIKNEFNNKFMHAKKFLQLSRNDYEHQHNSIFFDKNSQSIAYYSGNPFIIPWIDVIKLEKHYIGNLHYKQQIMSDFVIFQKQIKSYMFNHKIYLYCNLNYLRNSSSVLYPVGISHKLFEPFSQIELLQIYDNMLNTLKKEDNYVFHVIDDKKMKLSPYVNIQIYQDNTIIYTKDFSLNILETTVHHDFQLLPLVFEDLEECIFDEKTSLSLLENILHKSTNLQFI